MPDEIMKPENPLPKLRLTDERDGVALRLRTKGWLLATFHDTTFTAQHMNLPRIASAIVAACNAYPGLVARVAALEAENERIRAAMGGYPDSDLASLATTLKARDVRAEELEAECAEYRRLLYASARALKRHPLCEGEMYLLDEINAALAPKEPQ